MIILKSFNHPLHHRKIYYHLLNYYHYSFQKDHLILENLILLKILFFHFLNYFFCFYDFFHLTFSFRYYIY
ncbi:hypothetical protein BCR36DRAFT_10819 [Piromyces finnis]|uniref:Uncharacterized protein n=1 Tax=Piromyces finnis TaxID=1754191 RepID=A0A1Y1VF47_9FUNG|nr:hypothetical protein BCR36DRAFT_10819 [Piromyces finnis]|eukprot:ORX54736.1 hypothetical protein BCR36DRAFT_10819 [Piromyces finnis]